MHGGKRHAHDIGLRNGAAMVALNAQAETEKFDTTKVGAIPTGWTAGVTGSGTPHGAVEGDADAPSAPNVLKQTGKGTFPWCVKNAAVLADG